jgi:hypothetical protein
MAAAQQEEKNWNIVAGGNINAQLNYLVNSFTPEQCKEVVQLLHAMHVSFDSIIQMRSSIGTFREKTLNSFLYKLTLKRYLEQNLSTPGQAPWPHTPANIDNLCELLTSNPGQKNQSSGLLGWYIEENRAPVLCEIVSPWNETRQIMINHLSREEGLHYTRYQLKQWANEKFPRWKQAQRYEELENKAREQLGGNARRDAIKQKMLTILEETGKNQEQIRELFDLTPQGVIKKTNFPYLPRALRDSVYDDDDIDVAARKITDVLWAQGIYLQEEEEEDGLTEQELEQGIFNKIKEVMEKCQDKKNTKFDGANATPPPAMRQWLLDDTLSPDANDWMCSSDNCFDEEELEICNFFPWTINADGTLKYPIVIQELTDESRKEFGFSMLGQERRLLHMKDFEHFFLLPKAQLQNMYILYNTLDRNNVIFGIENATGAGGAIEMDDDIDFNQTVLWRRYCQGTIRDGYDKYGVNPANQLEVKTSRIVAGGVAESNDFGNPHRNPTPAIKVVNPKGKKKSPGGLVCAICCRNPKQKPIKDDWPAELNPSKFNGLAPKARGKVEKTLAQEYDVDHIANLIFNALLDLNYSGLGFLNTCAGCNRHLKGEKLWSPSYELWQALLNRAGLNERTYPWPGRNSPGLLIDKPFGGDRVYTIVAYHKDANKKKSELKDHFDNEEFEKGQGAFGHYSSNPRGELKIKPVELEGVILDRYMQTIAVAKKNLVGKNVVQEMLEKEEKKPGSGPMAFRNEYLALVKNFPVIATFENQLENIDRAIEAVQHDPHQPLAAGTEGVINPVNLIPLSPGSRQSSQSTDHEMTPSSQDSDFFDYGSENSNDAWPVAGSPGQQFDARSRLLFAGELRAHENLRRSDIVTKGTYNNSRAGFSMFSRPLGTTSNYRQPISLTVGDFRDKIMTSNTSASVLGRNRQPESALYGKRFPTIPGVGERLGGLFIELPNQEGWLRWRDEDDERMPYLFNDAANTFEFWERLMKSGNTLATYLMTKIINLAKKWEPLFDSRTILEIEQEWSITWGIWSQAWVELTQKMKQVQIDLNKLSKLEKSLKDRGDNANAAKTRVDINSLKERRRRLQQVDKEQKIKGTVKKIALLIINFMNKAKISNQIKQSPNYIRKRRRAVRYSNSNSGRTSSRRRLDSVSVCLCSLPPDVANPMAGTFLWGRATGTYLIRLAAGNAGMETRAPEDASVLSILSDNLVGGTYGNLIFSLRYNWVNGSNQEQTGIQISPEWNVGMQPNETEDVQRQNGRQTRPNDMNYNRPDVGGNDTSITDGLNRIDFLMTEDIKRKDTYTPLADSTMPGIEYPRILAKVMHWWSGRLVLDALKTYCPMGNWEAEVVVHGRPTHIINSNTENIGIRLDITTVPGHWSIFYKLPGQSWAQAIRVPDSPETGIYPVHRRGGDCGPSAVIWAIVIFIMHNQSCWGVPQYDEESFTLIQPQAPPDNRITPLWQYLNNSLRR